MIDDDDTKHQDQTVRGLVAKRSYIILPVSPAFSCGVDRRSPRGSIDRDNPGAARSSKGMIEYKHRRWKAGFESEYM